MLTGTLARGGHVSGNTGHSQFGTVGTIIGVVIVGLIIVGYYVLRRRG